MPRRQRFARYTITLPTGRGFFDMAGFLDMLRYEGSTVRGWDRQGENFSVDLQVEANRYTPDRWRSFGLVPTNVEEDVYL